MGGLFGKKTQSTTPTRLNGISINQSVYGNAVTLLYGTSRIPLTLIDYVDFKATPHSDSTGGKGGGGGSTSSYTYSASIVGLLGEGTITDVLTVYSDKTQTTLAEVNLTLFKGAGLQAPWSYMTQFHPDHALPYDHLAYVAGANFDLGSSAGLPNLTFEVKGLKLYADTLDAEPSDIIVDYCTDFHHGIGFNYLSGLKGTNSYSTYCIAMDFLISPQETTQRQAQDFIKELLQVTNSNSVFTPGNGLRIVPYADQAVTGNGVTYTPDLTPEYRFKDADYLYEAGQPPIKWTAVPTKQTFNIWTVEYLNRANQYNVDTETYSDEQDIAINGKRAAPTVSLHSITRASVALRVATHLCLRNLYVRRQGVFKVRADFSLLEPMDYVAVDDPVTGDVDKLVRIIKTEDSIDADRGEVFTITAEEVLVGPASAPIYDTELAQGYAANYGADPGNVVKPYIFTAPPALTSSASGGYEEWIAVTGSTGLWGGAYIWASLDNQTYSRIGIKSNPSRYGTLVSTLASGSDPDTSNTLVLAFGGSLPITLDSATRSSADALRMLLIVDGEIMAFQNVTPMGSNQFSVSYLRRGLYGSPISQHLAGAPFAVLDDAIFRYSFNPGLSGQPVWFKFVSFNYWFGGQQDISQVPAYQAFFQGQNHGQLLAPGATPLVARGDCVNVGSQIYKKLTAAAAWSSDCYSANAFAGACTARCRPMQTNGDFMFGLNADPLTDQSYASLDHAWRFADDGNSYIYESGSIVQFVRVYTTNDIAEIRYDGKYAIYILSGVEYRRIPDPGKAFFFDCSFFTPGAGADNVYFGALNPANSSPFTVRGQCIVSDESFRKYGGVNAWDSDIFSLEGYPACHVSFKASQTNAGFMIGLGTSPGLNSSYTSINFAMYCADNGAVGAYENGVSKQAFGSYSISDVFAVTYDGSSVAYKINNVTVRTVALVGATLFLDSSFAGPGAGANTVQYGPGAELQLADTAQLGLNSATDLSAQTIGSFTSHDVGFPAHGAGNTIASYAVSSYPFDVIVTFQTFGMIAYTPGTGTHQVCHYINLSNGGAEDQITFNNPASNFPLLARTVLHIAANSPAFTAYSVLAGAAGSDSVTISAASFYAEVVKR